VCSARAATAGGGRRDLLAGLTCHGRLSRPGADAVNGDARMQAGSTGTAAAETAGERETP
jgi:hypothetical protein